MDKTIKLKCITNCPLIGVARLGDFKNGDIVTVPENFGNELLETKHFEEIKEVKEEKIEKKKDKKKGGEKWDAQE